MPHRRLTPIRILSLLRKQGLYGSSGYTTNSSGLFNSAIFIVDMLKDALGHEAKLVIVNDSNDIDREVTKFKPDVVIIEALWVPPAKMKQLMKLHKKVQWIMRNHSAIPFLAHEGMAIEWMSAYSEIKRVFLASNFARTMRDFEIISGNSGLYLPNYYPPEFYPRHGWKPDDKVVNIGCFGAIRPLKNQLIQAVAAIRYAEEVNKELFFHINISRVEGGGDPIAKNLEALFAIGKKRNLVTHPWLKRDEFLELMRTMDVHMQVSFSETFNIVSADAVMNGVPIVVSPAIVWADEYNQADPNKSRDIANTLYRAVQSNDRNVRENKRRLRDHDEMAIEQWDAVLDSIA